MTDYYVASLVVGRRRGPVGIKVGDRELADLTLKAGLIDIIGSPGILPFSATIKGVITGADNKDIRARVPIENVITRTITDFVASTAALNRVIERRSPNIGSPQVAIIVKSLIDPNASIQPIISKGQVFNRKQLVNARSA